MENKNSRHMKKEKSVDNCMKIQYTNFKIYYKPFLSISFSSIDNQKSFWLIFTLDQFMQRNGKLEQF
jgi:hypothetical protein